MWMSAPSPKSNLIKGATGDWEVVIGMEIHAQVTPQPTEVIVTKRRVGAFATTDLESILRAHQVSTLVLLGIFLFVGAVSFVGAAVRESVLPVTREQALGVLEVYRDVE